MPVSATDMATFPLVGVATINFSMAAVAEINFPVPPPGWVNSLKTNLVTEGDDKQRRHENVCREYLDRPAIDKKREKSWGNLAYSSAYLSNDVGILFMTSSWP